MSVLNESRLHFRARFDALGSSTVQDVCMYVGIVVSVRDGTRVGC